MRAALLLVSTHLIIAFMATGCLCAEPAIDVWYGQEQRFGHLGGHPQRWVNILGNVSEPQLVKAVTYSLNNGPYQPLSFHEDRKRIARDGDFNVEIDRGRLREGKNTVDLLVNTDSGKSITSRVSVDYISAKQAWALPLSIRWEDYSTITDAVQVIDGKWKLTKGGIRSVERYYDRAVAFGDESWRDYEVSTTIVVHALTGPKIAGNDTGVTHAAIALRWPGHDEDGNQPTVKWHPLGATAEFRLGSDLQQCRWRIFDGQRQFYTEATRRRVLEFERKYSMKHRVETLDDSTSRYRVKLWEVEAPEPVAWDLQRLEPNDDVPNGSALLLAHHSDVTFGNIHVISLADAETRK